MGTTVIRLVDHAAPAPSEDAPDHDHGHADMTATVSPQHDAIGPGDNPFRFTGADKVHTIAVSLKLPLS